MLKPALARGELRCVGATTLDEYRKHIEKDPALERRFQPVMVREPSVEDTIAILRGLKEKYEVHHKVKIKDAALVAAAVLSHRYIARPLPARQGHRPDRRGGLAPPHRDRLDARTSSTRSSGGSCSSRSSASRWPASPTRVSRERLAEARRRAGRPEGELAGAQGPVAGARRAPSWPSARSRRSSRPPARPWPTPSGAAICRRPPSCATAR